MFLNRREQGLILPLFGLVLVVLLVMVAFAVDYGATAERRRSSQNRSDAAALAAARELGTSQARFASAAVQAAARVRATDVAMDYVQRNGGISPTDSAWDSCTDSNPLETESDSTQCISFSQDMTQVRVRVPDERVDYTFAKVVGINSNNVRSSAIAEVVSSVQNRTRPILLRAGVAGYNCIEAGGGGPEPPPCPGYELGPGDFGGMESPRYSVLTGGNADLQGALNFAIGIDHGLRLSPTNGTNYCDSDNSGDANKCRSQANNGLLNNTSGTYDLANYVIVTAGGNLQAVTDGLTGEGTGTTIDAAEPVTALLYRPDGADSGTFVPGGSPAMPYISFAGKTGLNGVHISKYLVPSLSTIGCDAVTTPDFRTASVDDPDYDSCNLALSTYINSTLSTPTTLFSRAILESPRFGIAPVTDTALSGTSAVAKVVDFYGIYIDRIWGNPAGQVKQIQAFVFPLTMVEPVSGGSGPGLPYVGGPFSVRLIR